MKLIKLLASLLALSTICMSDLYAAIIQVPADYPTISSAISAASPGDTIIVAAGVYNEHVVINVPNLTLLGAQANVDARMRTYTPANESTITFATPAFGTGIVNVVSPNVILNGFAVQGNGTTVSSTAAIFAGDAGLFLPSTTTIDVTGLQLLNNIVQNNSNGILIASIESTPKTPNYLVQYNYLQNNSGDPNSGNGQGVFFNNSAGSVMTNVTVTDNLFNGMETSSSVNLANVTTATVSYNVMNQDNSIALFATTGVSIIGNVTSGATGITSNTPSNTADAIFVGFGNSNTTITENLINTATSNGISIYRGSSNITITDNCIVGNTLAGISVNSGGVANSNVTINNNSIRMNTTGLNLDAGSYTSPPPLLDATSNYWNSALGPNYNGTSPGAGDLITDANISATQTVRYTPFLTNAIVCPYGATHFSVSAPGTSTVGASLNFSVTALDQFDNVSTGYAGTVHFTSTDGSAAFPADSTLTNGTGTFNATLNTAGNQTVTVTDTTTSSVTGTSGTIAVAKANQTITFDAQTPATQTFAANGTFGLNPIATASSGLPISYSSQALSVCTLSGTIVTMLSAGNCIIAADQAGNANYNAALQATQNVAIGVESQTITNFIATPPNPTFVPSGTFTVSATGGASGNPVTFSIAAASASVCTAGGVNSATITMLGAGACIVQANQAGNANYAAATQAQQTIAVGKDGTTMTLSATPNPSVVGQSAMLTATVAGDQPTGAVVFSDGGTTLASVALNASGVAIYSTTALSAGSHTITASYSGDANNQASSASLTQVVAAIQIPAPMLDRWSALLLGMLLAAAAGLPMAPRLRSRR